VAGEAGGLGMLKPSFVPPAEIRQLRDYTRLRTDLVRERARHWQRMEKLLEDARVRLSVLRANPWPGGFPFTYSSPTSQLQPKVPYHREHVAFMLNPEVGRPSCMCAESSSPRPRPWR
jgi:hypothetical protein